MNGSNFFPTESFLDSSTVFRTFSASSVDCACFWRVPICGFVPNIRQGDAFGETRDSHFLSFFDDFALKNLDFSKITKNFNPDFDGHEFLSY